MLNESRSTRYHRLRRRSALLSAAAAAALHAGLVATGAAVALRNLGVRLVGSAGLNPAPDSLAVVAVVVTVVALGQELLTLPGAAYRGFVLERRYELSCERFSRWAGEHVKAGLLALALTLGAALILYSLLRSRLDGWWVVAGAIFWVLTLGLAHVAPVAILPLFTRTTPIARPALVARLEALAARVGTRVVGVYAWHVGDRTRRANAALVGVGSTRRILLSDTLLADYSDEEIEAILAHELAHHVRRDVWRALAYEAIVILAGLFVVDRALDRVGPWAGLSGPADAAGVPLVVLAFGVVSAVQLPLANALSRHAERLADRFALAVTGRPQAFASAMRRLAAQNLAEEAPSALVRWCFYTHPPTAERIAAAEAARAGRP